mmetsp:Transcript_6313/g.13912  ORF Transcript_6313/g.13912 Transcript_6313/m.13912 type:complete len:268 (+) Transcript_6313:72-875(+)
MFATSIRASSPLQLIQNLRSATKTCATQGQLLISRGFSLSEAKASDFSESSASLAKQFDKDPAGAASEIAQALTPAQRAILVAAVLEHTKPEHVNDQYVDELFRASGKRAASSGMLTKGEFQQALLGHSYISSNHGKAEPSARALWMVFLASAIPFIGFGFLDNFIMLTAGEEIDTLFGARLGLSTLASAGLGNLVADVIGVSAANAIEQGVRRLPFIKDPKLSKFQASMPSTKAAKAIGATLGVMIGCLLGLTPLLATGHFFVKPH